MNVESSTIREIIVKSEAAYGPQDAFRYKVKIQHTATVLRLDDL